VADAAAIYQTSDLEELVRRASRTMFDADWPGTFSEWVEVFNWIGLNVEGGDEKAQRVAQRVVTVFHLPHSRDQVRRCIDFQRRQRRQMGIPEAEVAE
jgi:hypothetical protein